MKKLRPTVNLSHSLDYRLHMYTLSATAAGVSLLAMTSEADARIIYTKTHEVIGKNGVYQLDLNHDGNIDFLIQQSGYYYVSRYSAGLFAQNAVGNAVQGSLIKNKFKLAAALNPGARIGPGQAFQSTQSRGEAMLRLHYSAGSMNHSTTGSWLNVSNRYLGLKFLIGSKTHYGWARLTVQRNGPSITATLSGYAYETTANKGLRAGQTHGANSSISSLGALALGSANTATESRQ